MLAMLPMPAGGRNAVAGGPSPKAQQQPGQWCGDAARGGLGVRGRGAVCLRYPAVCLPWLVMTSQQWPLTRQWSCVVFIYVVMRCDMQARKVWSRLAAGQSV